MSDTDLINAFENVPAVLRKELLGLTREQMHARPVPGRWSTHEVAIHVADADAALLHRLRRVVAEDAPVYDNWSEDDFVAKLHYDQQSAEDAVQTVEIGHRQFARVIKALPAGWLDRTGTHRVNGPETARDLLHKASWHITHHLKFVAEKKAALGL